MLRRSISTKIVCKEYIEKLKISGKKLSTRANYIQKIEKYMLPNLPMTLKDIRKSHCDTLINVLQESLSNKSVNDIIILMNSILKFAFEQNYIKKVIIIDKLDDNAPDNIEIFTDIEQEILIKYILSHMDYFNFSVLLSLMTGIRIGELSALTTENMHDDFIEVNYTLQRVKNIDNQNIQPKTIIDISEPKSKNSKRTIPMPSMLRQVKRRLDYKEATYIVTGSKYPMEPRTIERNYKKILTDCNIVYRKFHTLRHTFAMNCVVTNMRIEMLAELLGHSSTEITKKYYIHFSLEMKKAELEKAHACRNNCLS